MHIIRSSIKAAYITAQTLLMQCSRDPLQRRSSALTESLARGIVRVGSPNSFVASCGNWEGAEHVYTCNHSLNRQRRLLFRDARDGPGLRKYEKEESIDFLC